MKASGAGARLGRTFLLQAAFIGLAALVGVFLSGLLLESLFIRQALRDEAEFFWEQRAIRPDFALPETRNLTGYMHAPPPELADKAPGLYEMGDVDPVDLVLVTERNGERLYLVFERPRVRELATFFGLVPLAGVLLVVYVSAWLGFRASRRVFSPVIALAREVRELDLESPDPARFSMQRLAKDADAEVRELAWALSRFADRLNRFVDRERHFTRDASHELRSPLTVIKMASELQLADESLSESTRRSAHRIHRSARDMEELIGAFLLLARESDAGLRLEAACVNDIVADELERARSIADGKPVTFSISADCRLCLNAPERVLSVLIGNLLRNAFAYTAAGQVEVEIVPGRVVITDSGVGMPESQMKRMYEPFVRGDTVESGGYGVGLTIVRRLSDRFGWPVNIDSKPGTGTRVEIEFPEATTEPLSSDTDRHPESRYPA